MLKVNVENTRLMKRAKRLLSRGRYTRFRNAYLKAQRASAKHPDKYPWCVCDAGVLFAAFQWGKTPQGWYYWNNWYDRLLVEDLYAELTTQ